MTGSAPDVARRGALDRAAEAWDSAPVSEVADPAVVLVVDRSLRTERRAWYTYDFAATVFYTIVVTVFFGPYLTSVATDAADSSGRIHPLGISMPPGSLFGYLLSASVVLQVLVMPLTGAVADRSGRKRELLAGFAGLGALTTMGLFFVSGGRYLLGAALFILANLAFGGAIVVYHSWLPDLAGPDDRDTVSSRGWAAGYVGGGLLLALCLVLFTLHDSLGLGVGQAVRVSLASAGVWWGFFAAVAIARLCNRPPRDPVDGSPAGSLAGGFRQLAVTLRHMRSYPLTLWFLGAFLLYNDGVQTVISVSAQYGADELRLSQTTLTAAILLVQVVAFFGAIGMGRVAVRAGAKRTVLWSLVVWTVVLIGAYFLAARAALQFYALAVVIGLVLGGTQALSRSLFSQLIPRGKEAEYFGFYEISDRGTSWLGPFVFALTFQLSGSYRYAIFSLVFFFVVGGLLLSRLDVRRAIVGAGNVPPERL